MGRRILWGYVLVGGLLTGCVSNEPWTTCYQCPVVDVVYFPEDYATRQDGVAFKQAVKTCTKKGKCLTKFTVIEHGNYHAVCGPKEEQICSE